MMIQACTLTLQIGHRTIYFYVLVAKTSLLTRAEEIYNLTYVTFVKSEIREKSLIKNSISYGSVFFTGNHLILL